MLQSSGREELKMELTKYLAVAVLGLAGSGCAQTYSIKLAQPSAPEVKHVQLVDQRPRDEHEFRYIDAVKLSYKSYLGDTNTTPNRISYLRSRVNEEASGVPTGAVVEAHHFEILHDRSGSACKFCAVAAVSYPAAVAANAGQTSGEDSFMCSISASVNGTEYAAEASTFYKMGALDNIYSEQVVAALNKCISSVVDTWLSKASASSR
jgi:hypothetical protein